MKIGFLEGSILEFFDQNLISSKTKVSKTCSSDFFRFLGFLEMAKKGVFWCFLKIGKSEISLF